MSNNLHSSVSNIMPQRDHVLIAIQKEKQNNTTESGIFLCNSQKQNVNSIGTILSIGNGRYSQNGIKIPVEVQEGDQVIFYEYSGVLIKETEEYVYKLIKENDILAIIIK